MRTPASEWLRCRGGCRGAGCCLWCADLALQSRRRDARIDERLIAPPRQLLGQRLPSALLHVLLSPQVPLVQLAQLTLRPHVRVARAQERVTAPQPIVRGVGDGEGPCRVRELLRVKVVDLAGDG